jgi:uncharacterized protein YkwD
MNIEAWWHVVVALIGLAIPVFNGQAPKPTPSPSPSPSMVVRTVNPTPSLTPAAVVRTTAPRPSSPATLKPTPVATAAKTEIASEQVCGGQGDVAKTTTALLCLTNQARTFHGLPAVQANSALMASAAAKNQDMLNCGYGHTACGRDFSSWIKAKGYTGRCSAENIAMGQRSPREVFVSWMNSAGHRANILNRNYRDLGVAQLASQRGPLWTMHLGGC